MTPLPPRDAPRCLRCGVLLPLHVAGCPEMRPPLSDAEFDPLFETEQVHTLPARAGYEVTQRSRFDEEES